MIITLVVGLVCFVLGNISAIHQIKGYRKALGIKGGLLTDPTDQREGK